MKKNLVLLLLSITMAISGCATDMNRTQKGALVGTGVGAGTGALLGQAIGRDTTSTVIGALAGAVVGGLAGGAIGGYMDRQEAELRRVESISQGATVERNQQQLLVTLRSDVLFDVDSARLKPGAYDELDHVADILTRYPETLVMVDGHTDSTGSEAHNQRLSENRAFAVTDALVQRGVDSRRITPRGFGESRPIASNATEAGRQLNRRVAITIIPVEK